MIDTTHKNVHLKNLINGNIPRSDVIDKRTINNHGLCNQYSKDGP